MRKITELIKSNAVRDHIEKNNIKLNMLQAIYVIFKNDELTFDDRLKWYLHVADTYDDMSIERPKKSIRNSIIFEVVQIKSLKEHIYLMVENEKKKYKEFFSTNDDSHYEPSLCRIIRSKVDGKKYEDEKYNTYAECIEAIKNSKSNIVKFPLTEKRFLVRKENNNEIDAYNQRKSRDSLIVYVNSNLDICKIEKSDDRNEIVAFTSFFWRVHLDFPVPFKCGDVLKYRSRFFSLICVGTMYDAENNIRNDGIANSFGGYEYIKDEDTFRCVDCFATCFFEYEYAADEDFVGKNAIMKLFANRLKKAHTNGTIIDNDNTLKLLGYNVRTNKYTLKKTTS